MITYDKILQQPDRLRGHYGDVMYVAGNVKRWVELHNGSVMRYPFVTMRSLLPDPPESLYMPSSHVFAKMSQASERRARACDRSPNTMFHTKVRSQVSRGIEERWHREQVKKDRSNGLA